MRRMCNDVCVYANDNSCDDGGPGSAYAECSLGADCSDCGRADRDPAQMDGWTPSLQDSGRWTSSSDRRWSMDDEEAERSRVAKELDDELDGGTELAPAKGRSISMDD